MQADISMRPAPVEVDRRPLQAFRGFFISLGNERYRAQDECVGVQFRHYGNLPMETGETALNDCRRW